jgi:hypothetical protein
MANRKAIVLMWRRANDISISFADAIESTHISLIHADHDVHVAAVTCAIEDIPDGVLDRARMLIEERLGRSPQGHPNVMPHHLELALSIADEAALLLAVL